MKKDRSTRDTSYIALDVLLGKPGAAEEYEADVRQRLGRYHRADEGLHRSALRREQLSRIPGIGRLFRRR